MRKPTGATCEPEYLEGESGWGFWQEGWLPDTAAFMRNCREVAHREMGLTDADWDVSFQLVRGYARHSTAGDEHTVRLSDKPNGGRKTTYIWCSL